MRDAADRAMGPRHGTGMSVDSDSSTWAQRLFDEVVDLPRPKRRQYLDEHCDDPQTLAEVESLLAAYDDAGEFLADDDAPRRDVDPHGVGSRIGAYELIELL